MPCSFADSGHDDLRSRLRRHGAFDQHGLMVLKLLPGFRDHVPRKVERQDQINDLGDSRCLLRLVLIAQLLVDADEVGNGVIPGLDDKSRDRLDEPVLAVLVIQLQLQGKTLQDGPSR